MPKPEPLRTIIAADQQLAGWQARRRREQALTAAVRRLLPRQLGDRVEAVELASGEMELLASAGAIAAAVRQRLPDVRQALQRDGWRCAGLNVRVRVVIADAAPPRRAPPAPDRNALAPLARLTRTLPPGPLKSALARMLRKTGGL